MTRAYHPLAEIFPLIEGDDFEALVADIRKHGLQERIVVHEDKILDGRNRYRACQAAGVEPTLTPFRGDDPFAFVVSSNLHRRHLNGEQKRDVIAKVLKAKPEASNNSIAKQVKADDKTVASVRRDLESTSEIPKLKKTVGADGKLRKAKPATKVPQARREKAAAQGYDFAAGPAGAPYMLPAKDTALERFDAAADELIRLTKGEKPQRFAKTAVPLPLLGDLAHYLRELVAARKQTDDEATP